MLKYSELSKLSFDWYSTKNILADFVSFGITCTEEETFLFSVFVRNGSDFSWNRLH